MKKLLSVIMVVCIIMSFAIAEMDLSAMTDEELYQLRTRINLELAERNVREENIIFENDDILLYSMNKGSDYSDGYHLKVAFVNKSDEDLGLMFDYVIINGWQFTIYDMIQPVQKGMKTQDTITLDYHSAELNDKSEMESLEFGFHTFTQTYDRTSYDHISFFPVWDEK